MSRQSIKALTTLAVCWVAVLAAGPVAAQEKPMQRTIVISADASVEADPDRARITSGVMSDASTAKEALAKNNEAMSAVIAEMKSQGIDAKDIQTSAFTIEPLFEQSEKSGQQPKVIGYRVSNQVEIVVRDLPKLGSILDAVTKSGANQMNGLNFEVSKAETLKDEARTKAVANAERRALLFAKAAKVELGNVLQISEDSSGPMPFAARAFSKSAGSVPIESGSVSLNARVTITWELK